MDVDALVKQWFTPPKEAAMEVDANPKSAPWADDSDHLEKPFNAYTYSEELQTVKTMMESRKATESEKDSEKSTTDGPTDNPKNHDMENANPGNDFPALPPPALGAGKFAQNQAAGPSGPKKAKLDYGKTANKSVKAHAILFVHTRQETKGPIE